MSTNHHGLTVPQYKIEVSGRIDPQRAAWLGDLDLKIHSTPEGKTISVLSGPVPDQAALYGIINRIRDMGLKLLSIHSMEYYRKNGSVTHQTKEENNGYTTVE
jgi:hypothetical protein